MHSQYVCDTKIIQRMYSFSETFSWNKIPLAVVAVEESIESCNCPSLQPISVRIDYLVFYMVRA